MQLDIFEDSRDVMLKNDVIDALERRDATSAASLRADLSREYPSMPCLPDLDQLIHALAQESPDIKTHGDLGTFRDWLTDSVEPAALRVLGNRAAKIWVSWLWKDLATRSAILPFQPAHSHDHAAPIYLRTGDWAAAVAATKTIESWRRKPVPLGWMLQANLALSGLTPNLGMLAELAWMAPLRLEEVVSSTTEPLLRQWVRQFEASFTDWESSADLVWFPAWALTERPNLAASFATAQPGNHSPPEQAMRIMTNLLGLERQGRHHDIIQERKNLKALSEAIFGAYMKNR